MKAKENEMELTRDMVAAEVMKTQAADEEAMKAALERLAACRLDLTKTFPADRNIMFLNGVPFLRKGNISIIQGKPKTGKSYLCSMLAATAVAGEYEDLTTFQGKGLDKMLYFDTEQSEEDATNLAKRILSMANRPTEAFPENFTMFSFRKLIPEDARTLFETTLKLERPALVIIDGITDMVDSPNDELEAKQRVAWLYNLAEEFSVHIMVVIHENSGTFDKARGHIGSELERKIETAIKLEVSPMEQNRIKRVEFKLTRNKSPENFQFTIDERALPHIEPWTDPVRSSLAKEPKISKEEMTLLRLKEAFDGKELMPQSKLVVALMDKANVGESTARRELYYGEKFGYLRKRGKNYVFTQADQQAPQAELPF